MSSVPSSVGRELEKYVRAEFSKREIFRAILFLLLVV
jgi:hypothetical protein